MAAYPPPGEETTGAVPFSFFVAKGVVIMLTSKTCLKFAESYPFPLLGITLGFLNLTN